MTHRPPVRPDRPAATASSADPGGEGVRPNERDAAPDDTEDEVTATTLTLPPEAEGVRLDKALAACLPELSRVRVQALLAEGAIRTLPDGGIPNARAPLPPGTLISVAIPPPVDAAPVPEDIPLTLLYEDEHVLVVDKPAGMVVHPGAGNATGTLVNALLHRCSDSLSGIGGVARPGIVHRLDKDTSGAMVVAKHDRAHAGLAAQFADRDGAGAGLSRTYLALCYGLPLPAVGTIDAAIGRDPRDRLRMAVRPDGKVARTHYRTLHAFGSVASLLVCTLETGRTHQIRVHLRHLGHPLIGDPVYGKRGGFAFPRQALHAWKLSFHHPITQMRMAFTADLPHDFKTVLETVAAETGIAVPPIPD